MTVMAVVPGLFLPLPKPRNNHYICVMQPLQCIFIDDEPKAITALAYDIQRIEQPETNLLASFTKARDALSYLSSPSGSDVDVVFLDIEMPDLNGLTFLDAFKDRNFDVVFTTAHSRYAIDAIRKGAFDYLVKPINRKELRSALERLLVRRRKKEGEEGPTLPETPSFGEGESRIRLKVDRKVLFLEPDEIIYCESDGNYCHIYLEGGKSLFLTQQLKAVGKLLPTPQFLRTHKSYIVNIHKVKAYHRVEHYLMLSNDKQIPVSRQLWSYFMSR